MSFENLPACSSDSYEFGSQDTYCKHWRSLQFIVYPKVNNVVIILFDSFQTIQGELTHL